MAMAAWRATPSTVSVLRAVAPPQQPQRTEKTSLKAPSSDGSTPTPPSSGAMSLRGPPAPVDWESHRATIKNLYMDRNLNLNEVVERMRANQFHATPRMYKAQFARWGWSKYNSKRRRLDISSGKPVEKSSGKSCHRVKRQRSQASKVAEDRDSSAQTSESGLPSTLPTVSTMTTAIIRRLAEQPSPPKSITYDNVATQCLHTILSDIRSYVYNFFSRRPDWHHLPKTGLISAYNYSFYDSFRIAMDNFLKHEHFHGGEILRQAFLEVEEAILSDYASTFYFFFIDLPHLFLHYGRHDIFTILLGHIKRLTSMRLRDKISGTGFASLHALAEMDPAFLRHYIATASGLWCDLLSELRGSRDRSTLLARRNYIRHSPTLEPARVKELCDDYDHLGAQVQEQFGPEHVASRHMEDVNLATRLNLDFFMDSFVKRNETLIEKVERRYRIAPSTTTNSPITPGIPASRSRNHVRTDGKVETLPLKDWDVLDRNIRSNCYHRLSCYYSNIGDAERASSYMNRASESWNGTFWHIEVETALVGAGRLFEAETLRRLRLEGQYYKKLPKNDSLITAAELDYYLNARPSVIRNRRHFSTGGVWAPSLGYGNLHGGKCILGG